MRCRKELPPIEKREKKPNQLRVMGGKRSAIRKFIKGLLLAKEKRGGGKESKSVGKRDDL